MKTVRPTACGQGVDDLSAPARSVVGTSDEKRLPILAVRELVATRIRIDVAKNQLGLRIVTMRRQAMRSSERDPAFDGFRAAAGSRVTESCSRNNLPYTSPS